MPRKCNWTYAVFNYPYVSILSLLQYGRCYSDKYKCQTLTRLTYCLYIHPVLLPIITRYQFPDSPNMTNLVLLGYLEIILPSIPDLFLMCRLVRLVATIPLPPQWAYSVMFFLMAVLALTFLPPIFLVNQPRNICPLRVGVFIFPSFLPLAILTLADFFPFLKLPPLPFSRTLKPRLTAVKDAFILWFAATLRKV